MELERSYRVVDNIGNVFLCQYLIDVELESEVIKFGSPYRKECIHIEVMEDFADLHNVIYDERCSYGRLERGAGTKSMLIAALNALKYLNPNVITFGLQDNSSVGEYNLSDYYIITRGITWYQTFLPVKLQTLSDSKQLTMLVRNLSKQLSTTSERMINAYGLTDYRDTVNDIFNSCRRLGNTWLQFHTLLFKTDSRFRNQRLFENILKFHSKNKITNNFSGTHFAGNLKDVQSNIIEFVEIPMVRFGQTGSGRSRNYLCTRGVHQFDEQEIFL